MGMGPGKIRTRGAGVAGRCEEGGRQQVNWATGHPVRGNCVGGTTVLCSVCGTIWCGVSSTSSSIWMPVDIIGCWWTSSVPAVKDIGVTLQAFATRGEEMPAPPGEVQSRFGRAVCQSVLRAIRDLVVL